MKASDTSADLSGRFRYMSTGVSLCSQYRGHDALAGREADGRKHPSPGPSPCKYWKSRRTLGNEKGLPNTVKPVSARPDVCRIVETHYVTICDSDRALVVRQPLDIDLKA